MTIGAPDHELENGARQTTPVGDNLQLDFARADAAAFAALALAVGGRVEHDPTLGIAMADAGSPCPFGNVAHFCRPLAHDETIAAAGLLRRFYGSAGGGPYIAFSAWPTADLSAHGLMLGGHPPLMARPAGNPPTELCSNDLEIVEVTDGACLEHFERTIVEAYPTAELLPFGAHPRLFGEALLGSAWRLFVGYHDGLPVATAGAFLAESIVGIEMVSTRPECRGRGFGAAITAAAAATAPELPAVLISSDLGRKVYAGLGFMPLLRQTVWVGSR